MRNAKRLFIILGILLWVALPAWATVYGKIKGRVFDEDTGEGIAGVKIYIYQLPPYGKGDLVLPPPFVKTDREGRWKKEVEPGKYCVDIAGYRDRNYYVDLPFDKNLEDPPHPILLAAWRRGHCFTIQPGEERYIEFPLRKGRWLKVFLTSMGEPLKGVKIFPGGRETDETGMGKVGGYRIGNLFPDFDFSENYKDKFHSCFYSPSYDEDNRYSGEEEIHLDFPWIKEGRPGIGIEVEGREIIRVDIRRIETEEKLEIGGIKFDFLECEGAFNTLPPGKYYIWVEYEGGSCEFNWRVEDKFYLIKLEPVPEGIHKCRILKVTPLDRIPKKK